VIVFSRQQAAAAVAADRLIWLLTAMTHQRYDYLTTASTASRQSGMASRSNRSIKAYSQPAARKVSTQRHML